MTDTAMIKIGIISRVTDTGIELVEIVLMITSVTRVRIDLIGVKQATLLCSVGTTITFLFRDGSYMSDLRLNYKISLALVETSSAKIK